MSRVSPVATGFQVAPKSSVSNSAPPSPTIAPRPLASTGSRAPPGPRAPRARPHPVDLGVAAAVGGKTRRAAVGPPTRGGPARGRPPPPPPGHPGAGRPAEPPLFPRHEHLALLDHG